MACAGPGLIGFGCAATGCLMVQREVGLGFGGRDVKGASHRRSALDICVPGTLGKMEPPDFLCSPVGSNQGCAVGQIIPQIAQSAARACLSAQLSPMLPTEGLMPAPLGLSV